MSLALCPLTLREAQDFVERHHRHSVAPRGQKFSIGAYDGERVVGVAIVGRPVARGLDDGWTAEVLRLCTTGEQNACSLLYAACWRACRAMGYRKLVTYTLKTEPGTSLRAAGFRVVGEVRKRSWDTPSRPRVDRDERQERSPREIPHHPPPPHHGRRAALLRRSRELGWRSARSDLKKRDRLNR